MSKTLNPGDQIPNIFLEDQDGSVVFLRGYIGVKCLVVYFYPRDGTPGCTAEAQAFRERLQEFELLGTQVIGISGDSVSSHQCFARENDLKFPLLSDPYHQAEKAFGVPRTFFGVIPGRVTFVFNQEGKLIGEFNSAIQATRHVDEALKALIRVEVS